MVDLLGLLRRVLQLEAAPLLVLQVLQHFSRRCACMHACAGAASAWLVCLFFRVENWSNTCNTNNGAGLRRNTRRNTCNTCSYNALRF